MQAQEVSHNQLRSTLDQFSRTHQGWSATLESSGTPSGQAIVRDMPFVGVSFDDHDKEDQVVIILGNQVDRNVNHIVSKPTQARITGNEQGREETIEIETQDGGRTVLRCYQATASSQSSSQQNSGLPGAGAGRRDEVGHSGVYPMSAAAGASGNAPLQGEMSWGQGKRGEEGYFDHGGSGIDQINDKTTTS